MQAKYSVHLDQNQCTVYLVNAIIAGHCAPGPCVVMSQIPWLLLLLLSCSSCNWGSCCHLEWRKRITAVSGLFVPAPVILPSVGSSHSVITAYYQISGPGHAVTPSRRPPCHESRTALHRAAAPPIIAINQNNDILMRLGLQSVTI